MQSRIVVTMVWYVAERYKPQTMVVSTRFLQILGLTPPTHY